FLLRAFFSVRTRRPPRFTLFPYTTLFRSEPFEDGLFEWAVEFLGGERLVLATDSPHWDSSQPGQVTGPISAITKISRENKKKVLDRKSTRLNSSHLGISYAVFCLKKKNKE